MIRIFSALVPVLFFASVSSAEFVPPHPQGIEVLSDLNLLRSLNVPILAQDPRINLGYARLDAMSAARLSQLNHARGRCGGYEALPPVPNGFTSNRQAEMAALADHVAKDRTYASFSPRRMLALPKRPEIEKALGQLSMDQLREFVTWASSFPSRDNRAPNPNVAVAALVEKLKALGATYRVPLQIDLISHKSTQQKTVRVRLVGSKSPQEVVVLGAHFDSISQGWLAPRAAPGADDDASGSANIFDVLRVILAQGQPTARTLEFYWYAGEESGLLGSSEIAEEAKAQKKNVVAVLQLDMTLFPGAGELVIGNMSDFTSAWLREFLVAMNTTYLGVKIADDTCGYGCSDHASWYRRGYPTLMPFEATMRTMNTRIHTQNDVITAQSSFTHSLIFSKIGLIFALELGNTPAVQPYR